MGGASCHQPTHQQQLNLTPILAPRVGDDDGVRGDGVEVVGTGGMLAAI